MFIKSAIKATFDFFALHVFIFAILSEFSMIRLFMLLLVIMLRVAGRRMMTAMLSMGREVVQLVIDTIERIRVLMSRLLGMNEATPAVIYALPAHT